MSISYRSMAFKIIRWIIGLLFLVSGIGKLISGSEARYLVELLATEYYWLIEYGSAIVITTSILELVLALLLLSNKFITWALSGTIALLAGFTSVLAYFYFQGMTIESCGCFGAFGFSSGLEFTLIRNIVLIVLAITAIILNQKTSVKNEEPNF